MKILTWLRAFHRDEEGAVTVDWVVLTAAIVGLGIAVVMSVRWGVNSLAGQIQSSLENATVAQLPELGTSTGW